MDSYQRVRKPDVPQEPNVIKLKTAGRSRSYVQYAMGLFTNEENPADKIILKAMGRVATQAVTVAEILKRKVAGLHQITNLESVTFNDVYEPLVEGLRVVEIQRVVSSISITLSKSPLDTAHPGYQAPLPESQVIGSSELEHDQRPRRRRRRRNSRRRNKTEDTAEGAAENATGAAGKKSRRRRSRRRGNKAANGEADNKTATVDTAASSGPAVKSEAICRKYSRGRCTRGEECMYVHSEEAKATYETQRAAREAAAKNAPPANCRKFNRGRCTREDCKFVHSEEAKAAFEAAREQKAAEHKAKQAERSKAKQAERKQANCRNFNRGRCTRENCKFVHSEEAKAAYEAERAASGAIDDPSEICRNFNRGRCNRGEECPYVHSEEAKAAYETARAERARASGMPDPSGNICRNFIRGRCAFGEDCKYTHSEEAKATYEAAQAALPESERDVNKPRRRRRRRRSRSRSRSRRGNNKVQEAAPAEPAAN
jgi:DNA-binding protein